MAGATALPLQEFIASLDDNCLPKILQVCSGVYFQGSFFYYYYYFSSVRWRVQKDSTYEIIDYFIAVRFSVFCLSFINLKLQSSVHSFYILYIFIPKLEVIIYKKNSGHLLYCSWLTTGNNSL